MVKLHIKKGDESLFLYETTVEVSVDDVLADVSAIYNGRLKVLRICPEMEQLASHGVTLPPNMMGLADEQIEELKLKDEWADKCTPSGGAVFKRDEIGRRNGQAPTEQMAAVLNKTIKEAKDMISKNKVKSEMFVTLPVVQEAINILKGATMIVYPMGLPPHDPIKMEFENTEELEGTQASKEVIPEPDASLWFAGKEMMRGKKLKDCIGKNEKTKVVAKLQKRGRGAPAREPVVNEDEQKAMMTYYYKKQEDMKKLHAESEDAYMDSNWADSGALKRQFQGLGNIKTGPLS